MSDTVASVPPSRPASVWGRIRSGTRHLFHRERRVLMLILLVLMFVVGALAPNIFITVPSGHAGVMWLRFFGGTRTTGGGLGEGLHIIFPWDRIFIYDVRLKEVDESYDVITREGLQFAVRITFRWRLNRGTLPLLHKEIGPNYLNVLMVPEIGSVVRSRISQYETEELFSKRRAQIQQEIYDFAVSDEMANRIGGSDEPPDSPNFVSLVDVLLKDVVLPPRLRGAIERKLEQAQISQEYTFRIQRERLESERKQIEAQGIQAFQQTVQQGISETYLKWRGIEATLQLAASNNAKVIVIGGGGAGGGLPLILNTGDSGAGPAAKLTSADSRRSAMRDADAASSGQLSGSIDMSPPRSTGDVSSGAIRQSLAANEAAGSEVLPLPTDVLPPTDGGGASRPGMSKPSDGQAGTGGGPRVDNLPPQILRSLADAFGYRLEKLEPASSEAVAPVARPE